MDPTLSSIVIHNYTSEQGFLENTGLNDFPDLVDRSLTTDPVGSLRVGRSRVRWETLSGSSGMDLLEIREGNRIPGK